VRLAGVFAHPDDDTYSIAGTVALHAEEPGSELAVLLATSGEAGQIADLSLASRETLGRVREEEDRESWRALGVRPAHHRFLRYPDGGLAGVPQEELVATLTEALMAAAPDVVATFGPDGVTGHEDHVAIGAATTEAFHVCRASGGGGFRRMLYNAIPSSGLGRFGELLRERGLEAPDPDEAFSVKGVPDEQIAVTVDCSSVFRRKLDALRRHRTQDEMESVPQDLWPLMLSTESFVQAWPERPPGAAILPDVFRGL
jgi:LmbE family N-acetylglucosaminyl deacetylase